MPKHYRGEVRKGVKRLDVDTYASNKKREKETRTIPFRPHRKPVSEDSSLQQHGSPTR